MYNGVLWVTNHSGKMQNMQSIGTSCATNPHCQKRMENNESVCAHCYASTYMKMRKSLKQHLERNAEILTVDLLTDRELPIINAAIFRFEAFGDLHNETQLKNYIAICNKNPDTNFGLWTKNFWILENVFNKEGVKKPENMVIIASSTKLNKAITINKKYIDHVFTVYDPEYIAEHNININCGAAVCATCRMCYKKDTPYHISEKLK